MLARNMEVASLSIFDIRQNVKKKKKKDMERGKPSPGTVSQSII